MDAKMNKTDLQIVADQTKRLLNNIIPDHVVRKLQVNQVYSEDHQMVGVFFATITNFLELYEENFESGKEFIRCVKSVFQWYFLSDSSSLTKKLFLCSAVVMMTIFRVLNEVITDIDELLERDAYQNHIEKIKTIQSTFMGASGLQLSRSTNSDRLVF